MDAVRDGEVLVVAASDEHVQRDETAGVQAVGVPRNEVVRHWGVAVVR